MRGKSLSNVIKGNLRHYIVLRM